MQKQIIPAEKNAYKKGEPPCIRTRQTHPEAAAYGSIKVHILNFLHRNYPLCENGADGALSLPGSGIFAPPAGSMA